MLPYRVPDYDRGRRWERRPYGKDHAYRRVFKPLTLSQQSSANDALTILSNTDVLQLGDNDPRFIRRTPVLNPCPAVSFSDSDSFQQQQHAGNAWTVLSRFDGLSTVDPDMFHHKLHNILTLDSVLHIWFDNLKLYFKATARSYNLCRTCRHTYGS
jgi:hypothetical protein